MSETYTKLFSSITHSTIWQEPDETRLVWITMLALADQHGYVGASVPGLAGAARVSLDACKAALDKFLAPDEWSRSQEFDGRRIEVADRGWNLLNYERFRDMRDEEVRKDYERDRKRKQRAKVVPDISGLSRDVPLGPALSAQAEAEAYTEAEKRKKEQSASGASLRPAALPKTKRPRRDEERADPFNDSAVTERAGAFIERYEDLYPKHRKGARYAVHPHRDYHAAVTLCHTWTDDTRLDKLAEIFLTTDHDFAESGSRTIPQFLALASWCDGKLAEWEQGRKAARA